MQDSRHNHTRPQAPLIPSEVQQELRSEFLMPGSSTALKSASPVSQGYPSMYSYSSARPLPASPMGPDSAVSAPAAVGVHNGAATSSGSTPWNTHTHAPTQGYAPRNGHNESFANSRRKSMLVQSASLIRPIVPAVPTANTLTVDQFETVRRHATTRSHDPRAQLELACRLCEAADHLAHRYTDPTHPSTKDVDMTQQAANRAAWTEQALAIARRLSRKIEFAEAQYFMGNILSSGSYGLETNHTKALEYYLRAAKQDHREACYHVAVCQEFGIGTVASIDRAMHFYKRAALLGHVAAMYKLAIFALSDNESTSTVVPAPNDSSATLTETSKEKPQKRDFATGFSWLKKAAEKADIRHPHALHELGLMYEHAPTSYYKRGDSLPLSEAKALEMYKSAAALGYAPSQTRLGRALEFGELGCQINPVSSLEYYYAAANQGDSDAELAMAGWCWTGGPSLPKDDNDALKWAERAAERGNARALYCLGYFCESGVGQKPDPDRALRCYEMAAEHGNARAIEKVKHYQAAAAAAPRSAYPIRSQVFKRTALHT